MMSNGKTGCNYGNLRAFEIDLIKSTPIGDIGGTLNRGRMTNFTSSSSLCVRRSLYLRSFFIEPEHQVIASLPPF